MGKMTPENPSLRARRHPTHSPDGSRATSTMPGHETAEEEHQETSRPPVVPPTIGPTQQSDNSPAPKTKTWRFWAVFPALCVTTFLSALDTSILSTALPTIARDIEAGEAYIWITNSYILSSTVVLPLFGQMANIFGRRWMLILFVVIFALGSGIAGGAYNVAMLISGRTVQGIGGGGINTLVDIVICDLVPLRQRGKYVAMMASVWAVGTVLGPVLGGVFSEYVSWRWIFYINLPLSAVSVVLLVLFLSVAHPPGVGSLEGQLRRVDVTGNSLLTTAVTAILVALSWAGTKHPWTSWSILVPLLLGVSGLPLFVLHQTSRFCQEPSIPVRILGSLTALCALWISFIQNALLYWVGYFLPLYFQAIRDLTATQSGLYVLPTTGAIAPSGIVTGIMIAAWGKYRVFHFVGYIFLTVSLGLYSLLDSMSPVQDWVGFQVLFGAGAGMIFSSTLPPIQATLPEADVATATATWQFMRSLGSIWGIAIPTAIFNTRVETMLHLIGDETLRHQLGRGGAYAMASEGIMRRLSSSPQLQDQVMQVYQNSLNWVWWMSIPFSVAGLVKCLPIRQLGLSEHLETDFGLETR